jgi:hypothetical protein
MAAQVWFGSIVIGARGARERGIADVLTCLAASGFSCNTLIENETENLA